MFSVMFTSLSAEFKVAKTLHLSIFRMQPSSPEPLAARDPGTLSLPLLPEISLSGPDKQHCTQGYSPQPVATNTRVKEMAKKKSSG